MKKIICLFIIFLLFFLSLKIYIESKEYKTEFDKLKEKLKQLSQNHQWKDIVPILKDEVINNFSEKNKIKLLMWRSSANRRMQNFKKALKDSSKALNIAEANFSKIKDEKFYLSVAGCFINSLYDCKKYVRARKFGNKIMKKYIHITYIPLVKDA